MQASALFLAADGVANEEIARRCHTTPDTVRPWRARFMERGVDAVGVIAPVRGRTFSWLPEAGYRHEQMHSVTAPKMGGDR